MKSEAWVDKLPPTIIHNFTELGSELQDHIRK